MQQYYKCSLDVFGASEINVAWHKIPFLDQPPSQFCQYFEHSKFTFGNNCTDSECTAYQRGGTLLGVVNQTSHRIVDMGHDNRNLGRWCWVLLQGTATNLLLVAASIVPVTPEGLQLRIVNNAGLC